MMQLDPVRTARALSIAASLASGLKANFGTMTKPLHIGHCSRNGLFAALIAEGGFEAADDVFEHHQGFLDVFNGPGTYDVEKMFESWGEPWEIEAPSIGLKQFPCCGSTHPAIIMALKLRDEEAISAGGYRANRGLAARAAPAAHQHTAAADTARGQVQRAICGRTRPAATGRSV